MKRKHAALIFALTACFYISSCDRKALPVGLFLYSGQDPYIEEFASQIRAESEGRLALRQFDALNSQLVQNEQLSSFLDEKPGLLLVNPVDRLGAYAIIKSPKTRAIPIIFFNREPLAKDLSLRKGIYYVGAKAEQSGQLQAQLVMDLFGGDPRALNSFDRNGDGIIQCIILKGEQGHQDAEIRTKEVLRKFENAGYKVEVLALEVANWNREEAYVRMGSLLASYRRRLELVLSNNDEMALGAIARMRQQGMFRDTNGNGKIDRHDEGWIPVVGIDGLKEAEESIRAGFLYGTVKNDSLGMAKAMVKLAYALIEGRDPRESGIAMEDGAYIWIDYSPYVGGD